MVTAVGSTTIGNICFALVTTDATVFTASAGTATANVIAAVVVQRRNIKTVGGRAAVRLVGTAATVIAIIVAGAFVAAAAAATGAAAAAICQANCSGIIFHSN